MNVRLGILLFTGAFALFIFAARGDDSAAPNGSGKPADAVVPIPQLGGEAEGIVQVANLVYAGSKSSKCFSDHFLIQAEQDSAISTSRRFHVVKLDSDDIYLYPLIVMTGEGSFTLSDAEHQSLRRYVERGGLLLASAGCSSKEWDASFRREMVAVFPSRPCRPSAWTIRCSKRFTTSRKSSRRAKSSWRALVIRAAWG